MHIYLLGWCGLHFHPPYVIYFYVSTWSFFSLYFWFIPIDSWIFPPWIPLWFCWILFQNTFPIKVHIVKVMVFPVAMHYGMYTGCDSWTIKKAKCWRIDAFELWCWRRLFERLLDSKEIKPVNPKGNKPWILIGRTDAEAETPVFWPHDVKSWLFGKDPDAGKDWLQKRGTTEDEMIGWHHQLSGHEFEQAPGDSEGQGSLMCCLSMGSQRVRRDLAIEQQQQIPKHIWGHMEDIILISWMLPSLYFAFILYW